MPCVRQVVFLDVSLRGGPYCPRCTWSCQQALPTTALSGTASELAEECRTYRGGLVPATMVVDQWRPWVNEIFVRWQNQIDCMACNEKSRQRARISQQSQLRLPGEEPRLAAACVRTGRAERAQASWRYLTKRVLRDAMTCAAIKEEHARRTLPIESARSIRDQPTMRRCACPRGCAKAVHGDQQYCAYCFVESGFE